MSGMFEVVRRYGTVRDGWRVIDTKEAPEVVVLDMFVDDLEAAEVVADALNVHFQRIPETGTEED